MRALMLTMTMLTAVPALAEMPKVARDCTRPKAVFAADRDTGGFRRLDQQPPAKQFLTVLREVDGCPAPAIVGGDTGATPRP